jgi:2-oxoglutarate ferredoxin oxidoreductase subunit gamma
MEREIMLTGIGGQGIQVAAKILAQAANREGREVMMFGIFMGMIRGGSSESTVVVSTEPIVAPPIVPKVWGVLAVHPEGLAALRPKVRPGGVVVTNASIAGRPVEWPADVCVLAVPATDLAKELGEPLGAGMVGLGALAAATGLVALDTLAAAMRDVLPPHRRHLIDGNVRCLAAGSEHVRARGLAAPALRAWADGAEPAAAPGARAAGRRSG